MHLLKESAPVTDHLPALLEHRQPAPLEATPALDRHPAAVYLARLAPGSRRSQGDALETMARIVSGGRVGAPDLDWPALRYQHTQAIRSALAERYAPATANRHLAALRGVLREAFRLGLVGAEDYQRAIDVQGVRGERLPAGRALDRGELVALFGACEARGGAGGARDAAILSVAYGAGLRRAELVGLDRGDYDRAGGTLTVRDGKGAKARQVYATNGGRLALEAWLEARGDAPGPLFVGVAKGGRIDPTLGRLTPQTVLDALARRAKDAGVADFSPHDLRRTFIGDLLDAGADISTVQRLAGHANVSTTARYDRRPEEAKRRASELLHVPYPPPKARRRAA
jgi:integrase